MISALTFLDSQKLLSSLYFFCICFSGDHDMCVPYTGTEAWTASLGYGIVDSWRHWIVNEQVAGYLNKHSRFSPKIFKSFYPGG